MASLTGPIGANLKSQSTCLNVFRNSQSKQQMIYVASAKDWMIKTGNTKLSLQRSMVSAIYFDLCLSLTPTIDQVFLTNLNFYRASTLPTG